MDFGRMFTENWPYKVAAIVLSVLLWLSVSAEQARNEQTVRTRLEIQLTDSTWSLREAPREVMTTFRVSAQDVFASRFDPPRIVKIIEAEPDSVMNISLSLADVIYNPALGVEPTAIEPANVTVRLERRAAKWVPVLGRTDARAEPGAVFVGMRVAPESVWLQGPRSSVSSINELTTELLAVGAVSAPVARQLAIELPPNMMGLTATPDRVLGSVEVDSVTTRRFQRAVTPNGAYARGVTVDPPTVTVAVTGARATVDALAPSDLRVTIELADPVEVGTTRPVRVELPFGVTATSVVDPLRVTVVSAPTSLGPSTP